MVEFNHTRRAKFIETIARAAGASPADVTESSKYPTPYVSNPLINPTP
jgi:hypothetical protein